MNKELKSLICRAAAALETPADLTEQDRLDLIEDLVVAANSSESENETGT